MRIHCLTCLWSAAFLCRALSTAFISLFSSALFSGIFATQHGSARNALRVYTHARAYVLSMLLQIFIRLGLLRFNVYWGTCKVNAFRPRCLAEVVAPENDMAEGVMPCFSVVPRMRDRSRKEVMANVERLQRENERSGEWE